MADFQSINIYVDIDALFDTRMVTLMDFGIDKVEHHVPRDYYEREMDCFEGITLEEFEERYNKRDINTLKRAVITPIAAYIHDFAKRTLVALVSSPLRRQPKVCLNLYPYILDEKSVEMIILGLRAVTKNIIDVEAIYMTPEELTPQHVKENFAQLVMYSYWNWLEIHSLNKNLEHCSCPSVGLIGPQLVREKKATRSTTFDIYGAIETYTRLFIKLQLYPISMFNADVRRMKSVQEKEKIEKKPA